MIGHQIQRWIGLALFLLLLAGCGGLAGEPVIVGTIPPPRATTAPQPVSLPQSAPDVALGAQIYAANCTRCHGTGGKGDGEFVLSGKIPSIIDFTDPLVSRDATPAEWYEIVTNGRLDQFMPPWNEKLSDNERLAVTAYVYSLADTAAMITAGETVWTAKCAECHGPNGEGTDKAHPLKSLLETSTAELLTTLSDGIKDKMDAFKSELSADELQAVAAYTRKLSLTNASGAPQQVASVPTSAPASAQSEPASTENASSQPEPASTEDASAIAGTPGAIIGKVVNQTAGGTIPADLTLTLHVVNSQDSQSAGDIFHTSLNPDGTFRFENVSIQADREYLVVASSGENVYTSDMLPGDPTKTELELPVNIYDVGEDPASVHIDRMLMQVTPQADKLEVIQIISFINASDRAFLKRANGIQSSVSVTLPKGATYEDISGGTYQLSADGTQIIDTQPVIPGQAHLMHVGYTLPYSGSVTIEQPIEFAIDGQVEVLVETGGMTITGAELPSLGTSQLGNRTYMTYGGTLSRPAGQALRYDVSGSASSTSTTGTTTTNSGGVSPVAYILIAAGLVAIGMAIGFFMRERTTTRTADGSNPVITDLMKQIADLDVEFGNGQLKEAVYKKQRAALKARLVEQMKNQADTKT